MASWLLASVPVVILLLWSALQPAQLTHYQVLGLSRNASIHEIEAAYQVLSAPSDSSNIKKTREVANAYYVLSDAHRRRDYDYYGLSYVESEAVVREEPNLSTIPDITNLTSVLGSTRPWLIQLYSVASIKSREFLLVWERLAESFQGQVNVGKVELGNVELSNLLGKRWIKRHGVPLIVSVPSGCNKLNCLVRYMDELKYESILDWTATQVLSLPRIPYYSSQSLMPEFIQKSGPHKVKVLLFSDTGERALPFIREAAKTYGDYASFGCVLWRQHEVSIWKSRLGVESAPAIVFIRDPGVQPEIFYGKMTRDTFMELVEEHKNQVLPQLRTITATTLGCDAANYSAAGKEVSTWYCVVVAGKPGYRLDQLRSTMRMVQDELASEENEDAAAIAFREKRLSLSWLDGQTQRKFCYYCLASEIAHETCGPKQYGEEDVPRTFMMRFRRDLGGRQVSKKSLGLWQQGEDDDLASILIARYSGTSEISEILSWISNTVRDGDTNEIPFFKSKSAPELVAEEQSSSAALSAARNVASGVRSRLIETVNNLLLDIMDFIKR